jgi:VRR-NUC domain.
VIERSVKRKIRTVLNRYKEHGIYVYMPVPGGYGESSLDYLGFIYGRGFAVEAKAPGKKPTPRQDGTIERILASGVPVFVVNNDASLDVLDQWLTTVVNT